MTLLRRSKRLCEIPLNQNGQNGQQSQPQPQRKRKRRNRIAAQNADRSLPKRAKLSEKNLQRHQRAQKRQGDHESMGKTRKPPHAPTASSSKTTTVATTDKLFANKLAENGVRYEPFDTEAPDDAGDLKAILLEKQDIPSGAHGKWERLKILKREQAQNELTLQSLIVASMLTQHEEKAPFRYNRFYNQPWTEVENEITAGISDPRPDLTEAYVWSAYPTGTREDFEELVVTQYSYAMPTFAFESKGPSADHEEAIRQAAYDGAVMTHAAIAVDDHVGRSGVQLRKTKAITVTLSPSEICVYANHAVEEPSNNHKRSYHQYLLSKIDYLASEEEWNKAHMVLHNAQRLALELANARIEALQEYFEAKVVKQEKLKLQQAELQRQALAKTKAAINNPPPERAKKWNGKKMKSTHGGLETQNPTA